jgi:hypothetical protein
MLDQIRKGVPLRKVASPEVIRQQWTDYHTRLMLSIREGIPLRKPGNDPDFEKRIRQLQLKNYAKIKQRAPDSNSSLSKKLVAVLNQRKSRMKHIYDTFRESESMLPVEAVGNELIDKEMSKMLQFANLNSIEEKDQSGQKLNVADANRKKLQQNILQSRFKRANKSKSISGAISSSSSSDQQVSPQAMSEIMNKAVQSFANAPKPKYVLPTASNKAPTLQTSQTFSYSSNLQPIAQSDSFSEDDEDYDDFSD